jgi:hypothetical protein
LRESGEANILGNAVVSVNFTDCIHLLQHPILYFSKVKGLFVVLRLDNNLGLLLGSLQIFHCFDELGIKFCRGVHGRRCGWQNCFFTSAVDRDLHFDSFIIVVDLHVCQSGIGAEKICYTCLLGFKTLTDKGGFNEWAWDEGHGPEAFGGDTSWVACPGQGSGGDNCIEHFLCVVLDFNLVDDVGHALCPKNRAHLK